MLNTEQVKVIKDYVKQQYPLEAVVAVMLNGELKFLENISKNPTKEFVVDFYSEEIQYLIHSHPGATPEPGKTDMESQEAMNIPWGIVSVNKTGDNLYVSEINWFGLKDQLYSPLLGRMFKHGIYDCYSAIRSFYAQDFDQISNDFQQMGRELRTYLPTKPVVVLGDHPRNVEWWDDGEDLYKEGFGKEGFKSIPKEKLEPGDVILYKIRSRVLNHGAVYLGDNLIYHHLFNKVSNRTCYGQWEKFSCLYLRYVA